MLVHTQHKVIFNWNLSPGRTALEGPVEKNLCVFRDEKPVIPFDCCCTVVQVSQYSLPCDVPFSMEPVLIPFIHHPVAALKEIFGGVQIIDQKLRRASAALP